MMLLLYVVGYVDEHVIGLYCLIMSGYDTPRDHCTCRFGMKLLGSVLYVKLICTNEHEMLILFCDVMSLIMIVLYVVVIIILYMLSCMCIRGFQIT